MEGDLAGCSEYTKGSVEQEYSVEGTSLARDLVKNHNDHDLKADVDHIIKEKESVNIDVEKSSLSKEETELGQNNNVEWIVSLHYTGKDKNKSADLKREKTMQTCINTESEIPLSENIVEEHQDLPMDFKDRNSCVVRQVTQKPEHVLEMHETVHSEDYEDCINLGKEIDNTDVNRTDRLTVNSNFSSVNQWKMVDKINDLLIMLTSIYQNESHFAINQPALPFKEIQIDGSRSIIICKYQVCDLIQSLTSIVHRTQADQGDKKVQPSSPIQRVIISHSCLLIPHHMSNSHHEVPKITVPQEPLQPADNQSKGIRLSREEFMCGRESIQPIYSISRNNCNFELPWNPSTYLTHQKLPSMLVERRVDGILNSSPDLSFRGTAYDMKPDMTCTLMCNQRRSKDPSFEAINEIDVHSGKEWTSYNKSFWPSDGKSQVDSEKCYLNWSQDHLYFSNGVTVRAIPFGTEAVRPRSYIVQNDDRYHYVCFRLASFSQYQGSGFGTRLAQSGFVYDVSRNMVMCPWDGSDVSSEITRNQHIMSYAFVRQFYQINIPLHEAPSPPLPAAFGFDMAATMTFSPATEEQPDRIQSQTETDSTEVASREEPNQNAGYGLGQSSEGLNAAVIGPVGLKDQEETNYIVHHAENNNADAISVMTLYIWDLLEGKRGSRVSCQHSEGSRDENMDIETLSGCMWLLKWQPLKLCTVQTFQYDKKEHSWMSKQISQERGLHSISVEGYGDFIDGVTEECIDKIGNDSDIRGRSLGLTLKLSDKRENEIFIKFVILYTIAKESNSTEIESCRIREERVDLTATLCAEVEAENLRFKKGTVKVIAQNSYGKELADLRVNEITVVVTAQTIFSTESVVKNLIVKKETAECTFRTSGEAEVQDLVNVEALTVITKPQTSAGMEVEYLRVEKGTVDNAAQMSDCTYIEDLRVKKRSWEMTVQSSISEKAKNQIVSDETLKISAKSTDGISSKVHTEKGENVKSIAKEDGILEDYAFCVYEELVKITPKATYKEMFESYKTECCLIDRDGKVEGYNNIVPSNGQDIAQYFDDCVKMDDLNKLSLQGTCKSEDVTNEDNINYLFSYQDIHKGMCQLDVLEILESIKEKRKQGYGAKEREHGLLEKRDVEIVPCFQEGGPWLESHPSVSGVHHEFTPVTSNEESLLPVVVTEEPFDAFPLKFKEISDDNSDHSSISTDRCSDFISLEFIKKKALCSELHFRTTENPPSFVSLKSNKKRMEGLIHLKEIVKLQSCRWQLESSSMKDFFETIDAGLHQVKNAVEIEQHIQSDTVTVQKEECVVEIDETSARDIDLTENKKYHLRKDVLFPRNWLPLPRLSRDAIVGFVEEQTHDGHGGSTLTPSEHEELREILRLLASDNVPGPQITMKYEMLRLCTMKTFPGRDRPFAIRIVGAGFYYAGHQDQVICYCCGNRKDSWVIGDIPLLIHQNMAPDCGFLAHNAEVNVPIRKANSSESPSLAEVRLLAVQRFYGSNQSDTAQSESSLMLPSSEQNWRHNVSDNLPTISAHVDSVEEPPPKYPQYAVKNMRINSFQGWPAELRQRPEEMAECGFYYAGFNDCVRCFFCGVGLRHWMSEDDPWIEHARWSMSCIYVLKMKGEEFVSLIKMAVEIAEREEAARNNSGGNQASKENKEAAPTVVIQEAPKSSVTTNSTAIKDLPGSVGATDGNVVRGAESSQPPGNSEIQKYLLTDAAQSVLDMGYQPKLVQRAIERVLIKKATEELTGEIIMEAVFEIDEEDKLQSKKPVSLQSAEGDKSSEKGHEASGNTQAEGSQIDPEKIIREHRELREATLCKICMENTISVVFLPCGHLVTCPDCAPAMRKCPICRALIKGTVKTFYG